MSFAKISDEDVNRLRARIGTPIQRVTPPFYTELNADAARHFAGAIGDDNPLWVQPGYGLKTRWNSQLCPPCILYSTDNVVSGAVEGLPSVHAMFAGTDWQWFEPIKVGTVMKTRSVLKDMVEHQTRFAGRSFQQIYTTEFFDQHGTRIAQADSWCFRTERDTARESGSKYKTVAAAPIVYSDQDIGAFAAQYRQEKPRGAETRTWVGCEPDVNTESSLPATSRLRSGGVSSGAGSEVLTRKNSGHTARLSASPQPLIVNATPVSSAATQTCRCPMELI